MIFFSSKFFNVVVFFANLAIPKSVIFLLLSMIKFIISVFAIWMRLILVRYKQCINSNFVRVFILLIWHIPISVILLLLVNIIIVSDLLRDRHFMLSSVASSPVNFIMLSEE